MVIAESGRMGQIRVWDWVGSGRITIQEGDKFGSSELRQTVNGELLSDAEVCSRRLSFLFSAVV